MDDFQKIEDHLEKGETKLALKKLKALLLIPNAICNKLKPEYLLHCSQLMGRLAIWRRNSLGNLYNAEFQTEEKNRINFAVNNLYYDIKERCYKKESVETFREKGLLEMETASSEESDIKERKAIELIFNLDFDEFSLADQNKIQSVIASLLLIKDQEVVIRKVKRGSVKIEVELPSRKLKDLVWALENGSLSEYKIINYTALPVRETEIVKEEDNELIRIWNDFRMTQNNESLGKLYEYFQPKLITIAKRYLKDTESAKDVVQDTFVRTISHLGNVDGNVAAYLSKAVKNICLNIKAREKQRQKLFENHEPIEINQFFTRINDSQDYVQKGKVLKHMIERLSEEQILVLQMTGEGYKSKDIAARIEKSVENVRYIRYKAWKILKSAPFINELLSNM